MTIKNSRLASEAELVLHGGIDQSGKRVDLVQPHDRAARVSSVNSVYDVSKCSSVKASV